MVDRAGGETWTYRPHLDGLRAVAVYLVVAFHSGIGRLEGGFIGVDVFFVLSGFLVTGILLRDLDGRGGVAFGRFYSRRARRLLPAAAVNLVVTAIVFSAIAAPAELAAARDAVRSAALYVSNWYFIAESADYFGADVDASPVAHYWSLSVEEQFYLLWPVVLAGLYAVAARAGRHRVAVVRAVVAGGALASVVAALVIAETDVDRAYFGTDTRAYQLLAGAFLALTPSIARRVGRLPGAQAALPIVTLGLLASLVGASTWVFPYGPVVRGVVATAVAAALIVSLEGATGGIGRWILSRRPLVFLGAVSYGTYLWHWLVVLVIARRFELSNLSTFAVTVPIATGLAALSFELLERPVREAPVLDRLRGPVIAVGLVVSLVVGLVVAPRILEVDQGARAEAAALAGAAEGTPNRVDWETAAADRYEYDRCPPSSAEACRLVDGSGADVLVVGESHAAMYLPMLEELAERHDWSLYGGLLDFCPWPRGVKYQRAGPACLEDQDQLYDEIVDSVDPDIVILGHRPIDDPRNGIGLAGPGGPLAADASSVALDAAVRRSVAQLREGDRTVVLLEPTPAAPADADPLTCLSSAEFLESCRFVSSTDPLPEELLFRELAATDERVVSVDLDRAVCPYLPICDPVVGGQVVKWDATHLTQSFGVSLLDPFDATLEASGVVG